MNINWEADELAKDRDRGTITDNRYRDQNRQLPQQEVSGDSYFSAAWLASQIEAANSENKSYFGLMDYVENLPTFEEIERLSEDVAIVLGLAIEVENRSSKPSEQLEVLFFWY